MKYFSFCLIPTIALYASFAAVAYAAEATPIPGLEFLQLNTDASIGDIFTRLYIWGIGFVALAAFLMLTAGGVRYMFAGDRDPGEAKQWMRNAVYGLLLALGSYLILYTINPQLVKVNIAELPKITAPGNNGSIIGTVKQNDSCRVVLDALPSETCESPLVCVGPVTYPALSEACYQALTGTDGRCEPADKICK